MLVVVAEVDAGIRNAVVVVVGNGDHGGGGGVV